MSSSVATLFPRLSAIQSTAHAATMHARELDVAGRRWWILHPEGQWIARWDVITSLMLIYTAIICPFEVAFLLNPPRWLFVLNRLVDFIFLVDMGVSFITMYRVTTQKAIDVDFEWKHHPRDIAAHYLRGWFLVDLLSVASSTFDILPLTQEPNASERGTSNLKALRMIRTLRLVKLVRLIRVSRILKQWETRIAMPYSSLTLAALFVAVILAVHYFACALILQTTFDSRIRSWLGSFGCAAAAHVSNPTASYHASSSPAHPHAHSPPVR